VAGHSILVVEALLGVDSIAVVVAVVVGGSMHLEVVEVGIVVVAAVGDMVELDPRRILPAEDKMGGVDPRKGIGQNLVGKEKRAGTHFFRLVICCDLAVVAWVVRHIVDDF